MVVGRLESAMQRMEARMMALESRAVTAERDKASLQVELQQLTENQQRGPCSQ